MPLVRCNSGSDCAHKSAIKLNSRHTRSKQSRDTRPRQNIQNVFGCEILCARCDVIKCALATTQATRQPCGFCILICTKLNGLNYLIKIPLEIHSYRRLSVRQNYVSSQLRFIRFYSANNLLVFKSIRISKLFMICPPRVCVRRTHALLCVHVIYILICNSLRDQFFNQMPCD